MFNNKRNQVKQIFDRFTAKFSKEAGAFSFEKFASAFKSVDESIKSGPSKVAQKYSTAYRDCFGQIAGDCLSLMSEGKLSKDKAGDVYSEFKAMMDGIFDIAYGSELKVDAKHFNSLHGVVVDVSGGAISDFENAQSAQTAFVDLIPNSSITKEYVRGGVTEAKLIGDLRAASGDMAGSEKGDNPEKLDRLAATLCATKSHYDNKPFILKWISFGERSAIAEGSRRMDAVRQATSSEASLADFIQEAGFKKSEGYEALKAGFFDKYRLIDSKEYTENLADEPEEEVAPEEKQPAKEDVKEVKKEDFNPYRKPVEFKKSDLAELEVDMPSEALAEGQTLSNDIRRQKEGMEIRD